MERRRFIQIAGGGVVLAAGACAGCSAFEVPASAVEAWRDPPNEMELRRWVLSYALLAPNPHNLQPWLADLGTDGEINLHLDPRRLLPITDPYGRQILMGAGAFLELLSMASAKRGHRVEVTLFPDGEPGAKLDAKPFARLRLIPSPDASSDPLFAQILKRRTDRRAYDPGRLIAAADVARLRAAASDLPVKFGLAGGETDAADSQPVAAIRDIARAAWRIEMTTEAPMMESMRLLRIGDREIDQHRDGVTITSPLVVLMTAFGLFNRSQFPAPDSQATQSQIREFDAITRSTPAYLWIVTEGNRRSQQIDAGRAYVRVNLAATAVGLAMQPNEQSLQEYAEQARPYQSIHALLDAPTPRFTVQMLARLGYLPPRTIPVPPAPRRGLTAQLAD
jgi:hypothetical protein